MGGRDAEHTYRAHTRHERPENETIQAILAIAARQDPPTGPRNVALLRLAFDLALRISELARLDVADADVKNGTLWIFGKGRRAKELVTMPRVDSRGGQSLARGAREKARIAPVLFSRSNRAARLVSRGVYRIIRDLGAATGEHVGPHGIRHTAITQAIDAAAENRLSIDVVRQFSRHRSLNTLMIYRDLHDNKQEVLAKWVSSRLPSKAKAG